jgi:hypothetical protein
MRKKIEVTYDVIYSHCGSYGWVRIGDARTKAKSIKRRYSDIVVQIIKRRAETISTVVEKI